MDMINRHRMTALPVDLLAAVLSFIEQKQRLLSCALVNKAWHAATKLTMRSLTCRLREPSHFQALSTWLTNNSNTSCMESMEIRSNLEPQQDIWELDSVALPALQLPWQKLHKLQVLRLKGCYLHPAVVADASSTLYPGSIAAQHAAAFAATGCLGQLTALIELKLDQCITSLGALGCCTALRHLDLSFRLSPDEVGPVPPDNSTAHEMALKDALPQLLHLTLLRLDKQLWHVPIGLKFSLFSPALRDLQQLRVLRLGRGLYMSDCSLASLPISLTQLVLQNCPFGCSSSGLALSASETPRLSQLTNLQYLDVDRMRKFEPALLTSYPHLTRFTLSDTNYSDADEVFRLMSALCSLKHLCHLELLGCSLAALHDPEPYAHLTFTSKLTYLGLVACDFSPEAFPHILSYNSPHATSLLHLSIDLWTCEAELADAALQLIVRCCPALQRLEVHAWNDATAVQGLDVLQALKSLTSLVLTGVRMSDDGFCRLAKCRQLQDLELSAVKASSSGLVHLTQLTRLAHLSCDLCEDYRRGEYERLSITSQAAASCTPDVHLQLSDHLEQRGILLGWY